MTEKTTGLTTDPDKVTLTNLKRKNVDASVSTMDIPDTDPEFLHSVLCQVGLPRLAMKRQTSFERSKAEG